MRSVNSGCWSRKKSNAVNPRSTFFDRSARSTRRMENSRRRASCCSSNSRTRSRAGDLLRGLVVDRERIGAHPDLAVVDEDDAAVHVHLELHEVAAALQEVAPVGAGVEADDVVGQQPAVDLVADLGGQHAPGVRLRPGDVHEVVQERVGALAADHPGQRVELVVVDHDHRLVLAVDLLQHGVRQVLVDDVVAELERLDLVAADVRRVALVPQVVLDEPEHRVGEDVVEAVVGVARPRPRSGRGTRRRAAPRPRRPRRRAPRTPARPAPSWRRRSRPRRGGRRGRSARWRGRPCRA